MNQSKRADSQKSVLSLAALTLALSGPAFAQAPAQPEMLEEVEVTGSYIPFAADAPAIPVDVLDASAIQRSGVAGSVLDVIKKSVPQFSGNSNLGSDNGNVSSGSTNGGSRLALRSRSTLVLVDGRRVAFSPVSASGGFQFVNVNAFPLAAIDSIEIVKDGASATYGSDAVSGVVNIKLKSDFEGFEVGGRYAVSDNDGSWTERSYYAVAGGKAKDTSVTVSYEWTRQDPLYQFERPFSSALFRSPTFAGVINDRNPNADGDLEFYLLNPNVNAPDGAASLSFADAVAQGIYEGPYLQDEIVNFFNLSAKPTMLIANERQSITAALKHELSDNVTLFGSLMYSNTETFSQLNAQPVSSTVADTTATSPFDESVTARNRFVDFPRKYFSNETITRGVFGARGSITDRVDFEIGGNMNYVSNDYKNQNLIDTTAYNAAVANLSYNPFARVQNPGVIEGFVGTAFGDYSSGLYSGDARIIADVVEMPAGMLKLAVGGETRRETLKFTNDRNSRDGLWLQATPEQPFQDEVDVQALFAEIRAPLTSPEQKIPGLYTVELSAAVRHEKYSNTDDPTVPKYSLRWLPVDEQFAMRASYAESFTAPTLYELNGPIGVGFTASQRLDRYDSTGTATGVRTGLRQYRSRSGSNPDLAPSKADSWTVGFVYSPKAVKGLSIEADWYNIDESELIDVIGSNTILQSVEALGPASPYANLVRLGESANGELRFDDGAPVTAPGQITSTASDQVWVSDANINIAGLQQTGLDVKVTYNFATESFGTFEVGSTLGWINSFKEKTLPDDDEFNYASSYTERWGTLPRWTTYSYVDWMFKGFTTTLANRFTPEVDDVGSDYTIEHHSTYDIAVAYNFSELRSPYLDGLSLRVGVNNIFNELTPFVPSESDQSADINYYSPIGRLWFIEGVYRF